MEDNNCRISSPKFSRVTLELFLEEDYSQRMVQFLESKSPDTSVISSMMD